MKQTILTGSILLVSLLGTGCSTVKHATSPSGQQDCDGEAHTRVCIQNVGKPESDSLKLF
jgi:hypothetical protein